LHGWVAKVARIAASRTPLTDRSKARHRKSSDETDMFAGHVGAGLAFGSADRSINVGVFVAAALLLDALLWSFVLLGWESVALPADFARSHQARYVFPYSHGLAAAIAWSVAVGTACFFGWRRRAKGALRAGLLVGAAVFSHWALDAAVHAPELPVAGADSAKVGLWLWRDMPAALCIEALLVIAGILLYLRGARLTRARSSAIALLSLLILGFTVTGMTIAPAPPSTPAMAASSLATLAVVGALYFWLGRAAARTARAHPER
jgi:hypothetical protein